MLDFQKKSSKTRKSLSVYKSNPLKKSVKEFRNLNKTYFRSEKKSQKKIKGIILQVKAPDGKLNVKRIQINNKVPEQVNTNNPKDS